MLSFREHAQVILVGAGFMGLLVLRYLAAIGHRVFVIEPRAAAQKLARSWGADTVVHPDEVAGGMRRSGPVVIEATGEEAGLHLASASSPSTAPSASWVTTSPAVAAA